MAAVNAKQRITGSTEIHRIECEQDISAVRCAVKALAQQAGLSLVNLTKLVTAASEIARNALVYGRGGLAKIEQLKLGTQEGVRVTISDNGPGIQDVEQALVDGFSSGRGMGLGLSGAKRLCDEFNIQTSTGHGTTVVITKWI